MKKTKPLLSGYLSIRRIDLLERTATYKVDLYAGSYEYTDGTQVSYNDRVGLENLGFSFYVEPKKIGEDGRPRTYGGDVLYLDRSHISERDLESMSKTMRKVRRKMAAIREKYGIPSTIENDAQLFAAAMGTSIKVRSRNYREGGFREVGKALFATDENGYYINDEREYSTGTFSVSDLVRRVISGLVAEHAPAEAASA
jgi:hypothetical protein